MGRGGQRYLSYSALVLLSAVSSASAGLWDVSIDLGPAPAPDKGPPFSAHAIRDPSLLPYEAVAIAGAYLVSVLVLGTLLLTVGRKARKRALAMMDRPTEMVKPSTKVFDPSPVSPRSFRNWGLRSKKSTTGSMKSGVSNVGSPGVASVGSFDQDAHKKHIQAMNEAHANMWGEAFAAEDGQNTQASPPAYTGSRPKPKRLQSLDEAYKGPSGPQTPLSPAYYRIDPPRDYEGPKSPYHDTSIRSPRSPGVATRTRGSSFGSNQTSEPASPGRNKLRKGFRQSLKDITISAPMRRDDNSDGALTPLSPRSYTNPGIPPPLPTSGTMDSDMYPPTTPGTARSFPFPEEDEDFDEVRDLPVPHPERIERQPQPASRPALDTELGLPPTPKRNGHSPASSTNNPLKLRQMDEQLRQARKAKEQALEQIAREPTYLCSAGQWNSVQSPGFSNSLQSPGFSIKSPGITKTTELNVDRNLLRGPATGREVPYSPYQPRTPITPLYGVSATTRAERKQKQKEQKALHGAIVEEDAVADDKDMWGDAY